MRKTIAGWIFLGLVAVLTVGIAAPATSASATQEFAAQSSRPRVTIYPRRLHRNAQRYCRAWLAQEYRVSGPVIVPRQQCWWK